MLGFGVPEDGLSVRSRGMGGAGSALPGIQFGFRNPAALAVFDRSGISAGAELQTRTPEDPEGDSRQNSAEIPFVQLAFPLGLDLVLGGGYYRYLDFDGFVDTSTGFEGESLSTRVTTDGGVSVLSPQLAWGPSRFVRLGGAVDFYTGKRERRREVEFDPTVGVSTEDSLAFDLGGTGFTLGAQVAPTRRVILAGGYRSGVTLDGGLDFAPGFDRDLAEGDTVSARDIEIELPASFFGAASVRVGRGLVLAAEVGRALWSDFALDGRRDPAYRDVLELAGGAEYAFARRVLFLPEGTVARVGARTRELPRRFGGDTVRETAVTLGLGQIVGIGASNLDLAVEVGKRGSLADNGLDEGFLRLGIAFSAFEQWSRGPGERP
jgi:hypothetical protein